MDVQPEDDQYLSRPRIILESPMGALPYDLKWEGLNSARFFEVQSARDDMFTVSRRSWTTRETSLELTDLEEGKSYIRIKAQFDEKSSRWSEVVCIERKGDALSLERMR